MEEHNKNKHKDFEELLRSMETRKTADLDDFEREALEGFASLESKDEAVKIQTELDEKIYKELFTEEKKKRPVIYWFAAAGLLLAIGLSVVFITNNENLTGKKNVAQTISLEESPAKDQEVISSAESFASAENLKQKKTEKNQGEQNTSDRAKIVPAPEEIFPKEQNGQDLKKNDAAGSLDVIEDANANKPVLADIKEKEKTEEVKVKDEEKNVVSAFYQNDHTTSVAREEKKEETAKTKNKQSAGKKAAPSSADKGEMPSSLSGNVAQNTSPPPQTEGKAATHQEENKTKLAEKDSKSNNESYCFYTGGKTALNDELKKKFSELEINKAFEASIFINEKKKVEKVTFTKTGELTSKEQKKISAVLKDLQGFSFFIQPTQKSLHEFKLSYIP